MLHTRKITARQMYCVLILTIGFSNHVQLIPVLLQIGRRDAWVGAVCAVLPAIGWVAIVGAIVRRIGQQKTVDWLSRRYGQTIKMLFVSVFVLYFSIISLITLKDTVTWTKVTYLPQTPLLVTAAAFMLMCVFAARAGLRAIAIAAGVLLPVVVAFGLFVMSANFHYKDYSLLAPLFTHGYAPALRSVVTACGGMFELTLIVFMHQQLSDKFKFSASAWVTAFLIILTVGPLTGAIAIFGPFQAAVMRYPAFEQWRMVHIGKFISHLDFLSIYQWISGAFVRISLMLFLTLELLGASQARLRNIVLIAIAGLIVVLALLPMSDDTFSSLLFQWYYPCALGLNLFMLLLLYVLTILPHRTKELRAS